MFITYKDIKEKRERNAELRDMAFQTVLNGQNLMREFGLISTEEYYKWRLPFDCERYGIDLHT